MSFVLRKEIRLDGYGWEGCSITLASVTYKEIQDWQKKYKDVKEEDAQNVDEVLGLLKKKFISGQGLNEKNEKVDITPDNLDQLPFEIMLGVIEDLVGSRPDPNLPAS